MQTRKFRYLPHMADIAFVAYGKNLGEVLENSALAMLGIMFDIQKIKKAKGSVKTMRITESASSSEDMVWFALQKIVSKVDEKGVSAFRFKVNRIVQGKNGITLHGCIFYKRIAKYSALLDVKAVTPHGLEVKRTKGGYSARVLVDV